MEKGFLSYIKNVDNVDSSKGIETFCQRCLFLLLILVPLNGINAQSKEVSIKDIRFRSAGATLVGTIYEPQHPHAAIVIVHGSGQESRSREFALFLAENGISVLTYDKRGVGESGGIYLGPEVGTNNIDSTNLALLADDACAAVNVLHECNTHVPIGLLGVSQAGWIIPIAATKNPLVDFMVVFSGSLVPTLEQLRFQFLTDGDPNFWDNHTEAEVRQHICCDADRYQFINTDPYDSLDRLSIDGLWLFGGKDIQIPVGLSIERLNNLKAKGKEYQYCLFSDLGHNVAFADSTEPMDITLNWIKNRQSKKIR